VEGAAALQGLLEDTARQRTLAGTGRGITRAWRQSAAVQALEAALQAQGQHPLPPLAAWRAALEPLLRDATLIAPLVEAGIAAFAADPFFELPVVTQHGPVLSGLSLLTVGPANLFLALLHADGLAAAEAPQIVLDGGCSLLLILKAGGLVVDHFSLTADGRMAHRRRIAMADGQMLAVDQSREQIHCVTAAGDAVILRLSVDRGAGQVRAYDAASGAFVQAGTGRPEVSRMLALLALIEGRGGADAAAVLAQLTHHGDAELRWTALRQWLACDVRGARARLDAMAVDDSDARLRAIARQTQAILTEQMVHA